MLPASLAMRSKVSWTKPFMTFMARLLIPISGCTCLSTLKMYRLNVSVRFFFLCVDVDVPRAGDRADIVLLLLLLTALSLI